jgi:hypothetical protein
VGEASGYADSERSVRAHLARYIVFVRHDGAKPLKLIQYNHLVATPNMRKSLDQADCRNERRRMFPDMVCIFTQISANYNYRCI